MMRRFVIAVVILALASCVPASVFADEGSAGDSSALRDLRYNTRMDLAVSSIAAAGWIVTWAATDQLAPSSCRWCLVNSFDDWGHRNLKWSNTGAASKASDVAAYAAAPLAAFGLDALAANHDGELSNFFVDALIVTEATALSQFTTQLVKIAAGRQRPDAHFGGGSQSPHDNISFYSGHASLAFALAVSSGTVATMRGYRLAPLIWGAGLGIAGTASYLRLAADKHYLTDTIAGAVLGSAFGFGIPYLFHRPRKNVPPKVMLSAFPADGGGIMSMSGRW